MERSGTPGRPPERTFLAPTGRNNSSNRHKKIVSPRWGEGRDGRVPGVPLRSTPGSHVSPPWGEETQLLVHDDNTNIANVGVRGACFNQSTGSFEKVVRVVAAQVVLRIQLMLV